MAFWIFQPLILLLQPESIFIIIIITSNSHNETELHKLIEWTLSLLLTCSDKSENYINNLEDCENDIQVQIQNFLQKCLDKLPKEEEDENSSSLNHSLNRSHLSISSDTNEKFDRQALIRQYEEEREQLIENAEIEKEGITNELNQAKESIQEYIKRIENLEKKVKYYEDALTKSDEESKQQENEYNIKLSEMKRKIEDLENKNNLLSNELGNNSIMNENNELNDMINKYKDKTIELELKNKNLQSTVYIYIYI